MVALTTSTAVWGSTFFLSKQVIAQHDAVTVLALRFAIGALLMLAVRPGCLRGLSRSFWLRGVGLGAIYGGAQLPHYYGLNEVPAATAGFLIGSYVVVVPLLDYVLFRRRASSRTLLGVLLAGAGLTVFAFSSAGSTLGFVLCLLAALVYALQISVMGAWSPQGGAWAFTLLQLATVALVTGVAATVRGLDVPDSGPDWLVVAYLAVVASVIAVGVQTWAQRRIPAAHAAVIMAGEPLWAAGLAVAFTAESVTARLLLGGTVLFVANAVIATAKGPAPESTPSTPSAPSAAAPAEHHRPELGQPDDDDPGTQRSSGAAVAVVHRSSRPTTPAHAAHHGSPQQQRRGEREAHE